jgi:hypothetical protein
MGDPPTKPTPPTEPTPFPPTEPTPFPPTEPTPPPPTEPTPPPPTEPTPPPPTEPTPPPPTEPTPPPPTEPAPPPPTEPTEPPPVGGGADLGLANDASSAALGYALEGLIQAVQQLSAAVTGGLSDPLVAYTGNPASGESGPYIDPGLLKAWRAGGQPEQLLAAAGDMTVDDPISAPGPQDVVTIANSSSTGDSQTQYGISVAKVTDVSGNTTTNTTISVLKTPWNTDEFDDLPTTPNSDGSFTPVGNAGFTTIGNSDQGFPLPSTPLTDPPRSRRPCPLNRQRPSPFPERRLRRRQSPRRQLRHPTNRTIRRDGMGWWTALSILWTL